jgi:hypothetical protein
MKKLWRLVMRKVRNCGRIEEYSRGMALCVHVVTLNINWLMECGTCSMVNIYQHFRETCYLLHQGVKMDGAGSFETLISICQTTQHHT